MATRRRLSKHEADTALAGPDWHLVTKQLPDDVDLELAVGHALDSLDTQPSVFASYFAEIPRAVRDACLAMIRASPRSAWRILVLELSARGMPWKDIAATIRLIDQPNQWGSKKTKELVEQLASSTAIVAAIQAAVVGDASADTTMLAVLAAEGSEASIDALLPRFVDPRRERDFESFMPFIAAKTTVNAMAETVATRRTGRNLESPATAFISSLVGAPLEEVKLFVRLASVELNDARVRQFQGGLFIESDANPWWRVSLARIVSVPIRAGMVESSEAERTSFGDGIETFDALELGATAIKALPQWLRRAETKLGIRFVVSEPSGSLHGTKRDAVRDWLFGVGER